MSNVPCAEVIFLHELFQDYHLHGFPSIQSKYIRISGLISAINYSEKYFIFEDIRNRLKLYVEISLIDYSLLKIDDLFQVIGTINRGFPPHSLDLVCINLLLLISTLLTQYIITISE